MDSQKQKINRFSAVLIVTTLLVSLAAGGLLGYSIVSRQINDLQSQVSTLQEQLASLQPVQNVIYQNATYQNVTYSIEDNVSLSELYNEIKDSVVIIRGVIVQTTFWGSYYTQVQGSGFVYNFTGQEVVITNFHVVQDTINVTITFANGDGYAAKVLGSDPYEDLAVLSANASSNEWRPLEITSSSTLEVGDPVIAVGNPYASLGLAGSMTTGIVSALGRTIAPSGYAIASVIQMSTPINPGNSGGPLLNYQGQVVGITNAIMSNSQGLGFAISSNAILKEIDSLVTKGSYDQHPALGATGTDMIPTGTDMTYEIAKAMGTNITYGWLVASVPSQTGLRGGTSQAIIAGNRVTIGGDIIIAVNNTRITNQYDLSSYLEEYTLPSQTMNLTVVRDNQTITIAVKLEARPPPT